jgi:hypothetical protein
MAGNLVRVWGRKAGGLSFVVVQVSESWDDGDLADSDLNWTNGN